MFFSVCLVAVCTAVWGRSCCFSMMSLTESVEGKSLPLRGGRLKGLDRAALGMGPVSLLARRRMDEILRVSALQHMLIGQIKVFRPFLHHPKIKLRVSSVRFLHLPN